MQQERVELQPGILVKDQVLDLIQRGSLRFTPALDSLQVQQHSIDLRLGYTFMIPKLWRITEAGREAILLDYQQTNKERYDTIQLDAKQIFDLLPEESVIACALEKISMPDNLMAVMYPRSSVSRKGLSIGQTGIVDAGYEGQLIIPITNRTHQLMRLYPGERFCQLVFTTLSQPTEIIESRWHNIDIVVSALPERVIREQKLITTGDIETLKKEFAITFSRHTDA